MKTIYLVWNQTNYGDGYEMLGAYTTEAKAQKAYAAEMKKRYKTTNLDELLDLWENAGDGNSDSWNITEVDLKG